MSSSDAYLAGNGASGVSSVSDGIRSADGLIA